MIRETHKAIPMGEKLSYGLGDTASNLVFQVMVNYMLIFYTDVFGIGAAAAGTLMLVVRLFDAVTDPLMGAITDRTRTRWGRYRPYLVISAVPYALLAVLAFYTPQVSDSAKLVYAYITYALLTLAYTAVNIPYSALGGVITENIRERASVQSVRFAFAMLGGVLVTALMMDMVKVLGGGDEARGYTLAMAVYAGLALACFLVCFLGTRERASPPADQESGSVLQDLAGLARNNQYLVIVSVALLFLTFIAIRGAVSPYYVQYLLGREELISAFLTTGMVGALMGALLTYALSSRVPKIELLKASALGIAVTKLLMYITPASELEVIFVLYFIANVFQMVVVPLMFSMVADSADYGQSITGRNTMGLAYSVQLLAIKLGLALGAACTGWILAATGYQANQAQGPEVLAGILWCFCLVPAGLCAGIWLLARWYRLDEDAMDEIHVGLNAAERGAV